MYTKPKVIIVPHKPKEVIIVQKGKKGMASPSKINKGKRDPNFAIQR